MEISSLETQIASVTSSGDMTAFSYCVTSMKVSVTWNEIVIVNGSFFFSFSLYSGYDFDFGGGGSFLYPVPFLLSFFFHDRVSLVPARVLFLHVDVSSPFLFQIAFFATPSCSSFSLSRILIKPM